jgi:hypothetical protein
MGSAGQPLAAGRIACRPSPGALARVRRVEWLRMVNWGGHLRVRSLSALGALTAVASSAWAMSSSCGRSRGIGGTSSCRVWIGFVRTRRAGGALGAQLAVRWCSMSERGVRLNSLDRQREYRIGHNGRRWEILDPAGEARSPGPTPGATRKRSAEAPPEVARAPRHASQGEDRPG